MVGGLKQPPLGQRLMVGIYPYKLLEIVEAKLGKSPEVSDNVRGFVVLFK